MGSTGVPNHGQAAIAACAEFHRRSLEDREGFWREEAKLVDWHDAVRAGPRLFAAAVCALVRRRHDEPVPQRRRPASRGRAAARRR